MSIVGLSALAQKINEEHLACEAAIAKGIQHGYRCGELLLKAKASVPHGHWTTWLEAHCIVGKRMAQNYMKLAREFAPENLPDGSIREAIAALAAPKTKRVALLPEAVGQNFEVIKQKGEHIKVPRPCCDKCQSPMELSRLGAISFDPVAIGELAASEHGRQVLALQARQIQDAESKREKLEAGELKPSSFLEAWVAEGGNCDEPFHYWWMCPKCWK